MSYLPRLAAATTADWPDLVAELDAWGSAGRVAALWWRDDDAVAATPELASLLRLAGEAPLALAVIPSAAQPDLAEALRGASSVSVLQHGWRHANRAALGKKTEYPDSRDRRAVAAELRAGRDRLAVLFGARALPVFVPPWNRFAAELLPLLPKAGLAAFSTMAGSRAAALPAGLAALDVHVDLVDWHGGRGFVGTAAALAALIARLRAQRLGFAPPEPVGLLTHHLVMDSAMAVFLNRLVPLVGSHAAARWMDIAEMPR